MREHRISACRFALACRFASALVVLAAAQAASAPQFEKDVLPLLSARCLKCHGGTKPKAGLDLQTRAGMLKGGESGAALTPGSAAKSLVFEMIRKGDMPPGKNPKLTAAEVALVGTWIDAGAPAAETNVSAEARVPTVTEEDRTFWAFRKPVRPAVPRVRHSEQVRTPIDAFLLAKLEAQNLTFSGEADRATLIRRLSFDLTGLPPSPREVDEFRSDGRSDAYERLVERLLASPHYGERWGRHWLDAAGYSDSVGGDNDPGQCFPREGMWRYRDYVVRALNEDRPFDRFLTEQLAGDEMDDWRSAPALTPPMREHLIATGFLRTSVDHTTEMELDRPFERYQVLHDTIENLTTNLLGLTVACARCHDHKFDPISQVEYYRLLAVLKPVYNPEQWIQPQNRHLDDVAPGRTTAPPKGPKAASGKIQAAWEPGAPPPTYVFRRGNLMTPGAEVQPGVFAVLTEPGTPTTFPPPPAGAKSSGRRTAFARWLTAPEHPLTARVFVNRVWQHHFGEGIVATPDNFGRLGARPTHPELLDWLATEFVRGGWRVKDLHRLIVTSTAYRQSSAPRPDAAAVDPSDQLLWRMRLRRLESEAVRDAILAVSGRLDRTFGGPPVPIEPHPDGMVVVPAKGLPTPTSGERRSIYLFARRNYNLTLLNVFDQPVMATNCTRRVHSAVPLQSLTLLNDAVLLEQADHFAARVIAAADSPGRRIETAFRLAFGREATATEVVAGTALLEKVRRHFAAEKLSPAETERRALARLCHMLLCANEFLYVG